MGPHRQYDPFTRSFMSLVPGQGHFGPDAIPGVSFAHISNPFRDPSHNLNYASTAPSNVLAYRVRNAPGLAVHCGCKLLVYGGANHLL